MTQYRPNKDFMERMLGFLIGTILASAISFHYAHSNACTCTRHDVPQCDSAMARTDKLDGNKEKEILK